MKRIIFPAAIIVLAIGYFHLFAQDKKKSRKPAHVAAPAVTSDSAAEPQDEEYSIPRDSSSETRYFLFPQFYSYWPIVNNDTVVKYECFDVNHNSIIVDTMTNVNDIQYITVVRIYSDYLKTYIDPEGKPQPQPVSKTLYTYERTGNNSWKGIEVKSGAVFSLEEHKGTIVRRDTTVVSNSITGHKQVTIREYYKVTEVEGSETTNASAPTENAPSRVLYYSVPEFYFHWPSKSGDTTYEFECYDQRDSLIPNVENYDSVKFFSLIKKFIDSTHTYRDDDGNKKPLPVSLIVKRYDHMGKDKWMSVEYPSNKFTELRAFRDIIVSVDTEAVVDPVSDRSVMKIYRHYKVIKN